METLLCLGSGLCLCLGAWVLTAQGGRAASKSGGDPRVRDSLGRLRVVCTAPPVVAFGETPYCRRVAEELARSARLAPLGVDRELASALVALWLVACGCTGALVALSVTGLVAGVAMGAVASLAWCSAREAARRRELARQVPDVFHSLAGALGAGRTLTQAISYVGSLGDGPLNREFARASLMVSCGTGATEAVGRVAKVTDAPGVELMVCALSVSARTGAPLQGLFLRSARLAERRFELERELTAKTAQVRLSARIVSALPALLVAALVLVFTTAFLLRETAIAHRSWFMPAVAAAVMGATGALNAFDKLLQLSVAVDLATEVVLTGLSAYLFHMALTAERLRLEREELRREAGGVLILCCALMALARVTIMDVLCLGRVAAVLCVMVSSFGAGAAEGALIGVITGLSMDLASPATPIFTICYGFAGLMSGVLKRQGRLVFLLVFLASNTLAVFWNWEANPCLPALYEAFCASVIFFVLPAKTMTFIVSMVQRPALGEGESGMRRYTAARTRALADAFRELYETVRRSAESKENDADIATVYDRAAEEVCVRCPRKEKCWQENYMDTLTLLNDATAAMRHRGHLELADLPARFREQCKSSAPFTAAVNSELRALIYRRQLRSRLRENRMAAYGQYRYLAGVLDAISEDLRCANGSDTIAERRLMRYLNSLDIDAEVSVFRDPTGRLRAVIESARLPILFREADYMQEVSDALGVRMCRPASFNQNDTRLVLLEAEPLAVSVGVAAVKKEGEPVSGDRGTYFKTEQGVLCVLLSDGMGSGEQAAKESISAVRILERFLRSGVEPATAMKILNSVMLLKSSESWGYAAIDLMCIDLFTGQAGFYKYGAAPSYIRSGRNVRRVKGMTMAAGVLAGEGEPPDVVRLHIRPGALAVIASDGVVTREDDTWLRRILLDDDGTDMRALARSVVREAGERYGFKDDMTVLAIRLEERK